MKVPNKTAGRRQRWKKLLPLPGFHQKGEIAVTHGTAVSLQKRDIKIYDIAIQLPWISSSEWNFLSVKISSALKLYVCWQSFMEERLDVEPIWNVEMKILSLISISDVTPSPNYWIQTNLKRKCENEGQMFFCLFSFPPDRGLYRANNMPAPLYIQALGQVGIAMITDDFSVV